MSGNSGIKHLFLTGYMGSGKSVIGSLLAEALSLPFYDLDQEIEEEGKLSVADIFKTKGEHYFRNKESTTLKHLIKNTKASVIALGGGTTVNPLNLKQCKNSGVLIFLEASISTLINRLNKNTETRPLLKRFNNKDELLLFIERHLSARKPLYYEAEIVANTDDKTPEQIVRELVISVKKKQLF